MVVRKRFRNVAQIFALYLVAGACVAFFLYHAQHGSRGMGSKLSLKAEIAEQHELLAGLVAERNAWNDRVDLLRRDATDKDILEERARAVIGRVHRNDVVIMGQ